MASIIKLSVFLLPLLFASLVLAHTNPSNDPNYITDDGNEPCTPGASPPGDGAGPNKDCPNKNKGQGGGGGIPNKDCPNKNKGQGGGGAAPADGKGGAGKGAIYGGNDVKASFFGPPLYQQPPLESKYMGEWKIHNPNAGVSAMQYQLMPNNRAVWFDTTNLGPSALELGPKGNCPPNPDTNNEPDCFAHAVSYDIESGVTTPVYIRTDPWCSSGHLLPNGDLMSTGGNKMGFRSVRILSGNTPTPKFEERENALGANRWYPSNCVLEDGSAVVVGGRDAYSYDLVPPQVDGKTQLFDFPFLKQTTDPPVIQGFYVENNLYPFVFLLPDGNVFIFANDRAIAFDPKTGKTVKEFPPLEGTSRNYPSSGMSALFPLRLSPKFDQPINVEVVVCGGNSHDAINQVDKKYTQNPVFVPANADCNRIKVMADKPVWEKEQDMPTPRTMGDLLQLPNGQFLLINGAKKGCSGWEDGEDPNLTPTVYMPEKEMGKRFKELQPTTIPRMYHSVSSVLPDGKILVAGSNAHQFYTFDGPYYPTELRVEKFSPHYLDPTFDKERPVINFGTDIVLKYGKPFKVTFTMKPDKQLGYGDIIVTLLYPPFTTHGFSQNQRMIILGVEGVDKNVVSAVAPPSGKIAPPGYYLLFVNNRSVPSAGIWVHLD
ncbi:aldehyde oxidase GLOX1-like [Cynara cardunculus var. scolymus]|uniref:aldehyde oxidase GLOX1-like n=1 Tax=Cynara cardunculus var. scolymus TaxID=59895 RepID=UPI000D62D57E|nr:aldehyde oxidase GLOX1-like [Cynara cardunculus var. scolymus]